MTKSRGIGRGGKRSNPGGRPPKAKGETPKQFAEKIVEEMDAILASQPAPELEDLIKTAYRTLDEVMRSRFIEAAPKISAARAVMAEAARRAGGGRSGKKGQQAEAAKAVGSGRFATPSAPRLAVDNT
jgi:hypothetical protein